VLDSSHASGPARVTELRRLASLASDTDGQLSHIDTGPAHALLPPLSTKHDTFIHDLTDVRTRLEHAAGVAVATADILEGPQNYLLVMANNAEMRAGSAIEALSNRSEKRYVPSGIAAMPARILRSA